jgi:hypothetical protein
MYFITKKYVASKREDLYFSCKQCLPTKHDLLANYHIDIVATYAKCELCIDKKKNEKND